MQGRVFSLALFYSLVGKASKNPRTFQELSTNFPGTPFSFVTQLVVFGNLAVCRLVRREGERNYFLIITQLVIFVEFGKQNNGAKGHSVLYCSLFCWAEHFYPLIFGCLSLNPSKKLCAFLSINQKSCCKQTRCSKDDENEWVNMFCPSEHRTIQNTEQTYLCQRCASVNA